MKNLIRQMVAQLAPSSATYPSASSDARRAAQRAAIEQGALVDVRHV